MSEERVKRVLAVTGVVVALVLAGLLVVFALCDRTDGGADGRAVESSSSTVRDDDGGIVVEDGEKAEATATPAELSAKIREVSSAYAQESAYVPYESGPYAGKTVYELLRLDGMLDDVEDDRLADEIKTAGVWPSDSTPESYAREIDSLQDEYDSWRVRLWRTACRQIEEKYVDGMRSIIADHSECSWGSVGDAPVNEGSKESYQSMVDWYVAAGAVSAQCDADRQYQPTVSE